MRNFFIPENQDTPQVSFDVATQVFEIKGESFGLCSMDFYLPIIQWLDAYTKQHQGTLTFNFKLLYYNTGSSQRFYEMMKLLERYHQSGRGQVKINWYTTSDESSIIEAGEDFQASIQIPFEIVLQDEVTVA
ncbi:DUF1987 domain-containing protein [Microscilla marina]|uniref:SiaC family regulatory phosphoprotein domain-containing protein n=1 Tax=Microscilla marina ATCC 23134 TaxID=313606 RepID=A1ZXH9_MICM2|nr:DUF1987 domain-containing protein [Microscilla marina]EAY24947.1 conserved hypothetical protein [Microscilla marina ATCC 23134]